METLLTPVPLDQLVHGFGTACLSILTLLTMTGKSRMTPLLTVVTGLVGFWLFLVLPVLFVSAAVASLILADLGILTFTLRRAGGWRGIRRALHDAAL